MPSEDNKVKAPDKAEKKPNPNKKKRRSPMKVIRDTISEVKKVSWPSKKEWINHTIIVAVFVVVMMAVVGLIDLGLSSLFGLVVS